MKIFLEFCFQTARTWTPKTMRSLARKYCEGGYTGVKNASKLSRIIRNLSLKFDLRD